MLRTFSIGTLAVVLTLALSASVKSQSNTVGRYLFAWTGDADRRDSDFLAVIDADPESATYAHVMKTVLVGALDTNPHHTEHTYSSGRALFASGYGGNRLFRFDIREPLAPKLLGSVPALRELHFAHSFERLPNGNVLVTMQTRTPEGSGPGGLAEFRDDGSLIRISSAATFETGLEEPHPYSLLILPNRDRLITTSARMGLPTWDPRRANFAHEHRGTHIQLWRLSDLRLRRQSSCHSRRLLDVTRTNPGCFPTERSSSPQVEVAYTVFEEPKRTTSALILCTISAVNSARFHW